VKPTQTSEFNKAVPDVVVILGILFSGCLTAMILHELTTPLPKGGLRIDLMYEIGVMAFVLNLTLPLAVLGLIWSSIVRMRARTFETVNFVVAATGVISTAACAIAMYRWLVIMNSGVNLWSQIWWAIGK
jgi:hypothetical protein